MTTIANRYAPMHIGNDPTIVVGGGGLFRVDSATRRIGFRFTLPDACTPDRLWIYYSTVGNPGNGLLKFRLTPGLASNPRQPDLSLGTIRVAIPLSTTPRWIALPLFETGGVDFRVHYNAGTVLHATFERQGGTFDASNHFDLIGVRSRFPLQFTSRSINALSSRDDMNATMASDDPSAAATPYCAQRRDNASFHPLFLMDCSDIGSFGNSFDVHTETLVYGINKYSAQIEIPNNQQVGFVSLYLRGAGAAGDAGLPVDSCYLTIYRIPLQPSQLSTNNFVPIYGPVELINPADRLFKSRSHWYGLFMSPSKLLVPGYRYVFEASAPLCSLAASTDAYLFSVDSSTLVTTPPAPSYLDGKAFAAYNNASLGDGDTGLILDDMGPQVIGIIDEMSPSGTTSFPGVWPHVAKFNDTVSIGLLVRNIGINSGAADIWSQLVDSTGTVISGPLLHAATDRNDEKLASHSFTMPNADIHFTYQCGHCDPPGSGLGGTLVLDDWSPGEVRLVP